MASTFLNEAIEVLKVLNENSYRELTFEEIQVLCSTHYPITNDMLRMILDDLKASGSITETFTVASVTDLDSKAEIKYKITASGSSNFSYLFQKRESLAFGSIGYDSEMSNSSKMSKNNKRLLIGSAIAFIVIIAVMIIVIASSG